MAFERMTATSPSDLPYIDVFSDAYAEDPKAVLAPIRAQSPVATSPRGIEALSYEACQAVYREQSLSVGQRELYIKGGISAGSFFDTFVKNINNVEHDQHTRLRKVVAPFFNPKRIEQLRSKTRDLIDRWLDEISGGGECDFMSVVGERLPASVFCVLIGAPIEDAGRVARLSKSMTKFFLGDPKYKDEVLDAFEELETYAKDLLETRRRNPKDDLLTGLVEAERRGDMIGVDSSTMIITILTASTDTTSGQLGLSMMALAANKDQWAELRRNQEHVATAVPEVARYAPGVWATARTAREQREFQGVQVEPGTQIWSNVVSANSDPAVFPRPELLDITRKSTQPPLNWGLGRHFCLGRFLAGMELEESLRSLSERWDDFEVVGEPALEGIPTLVSPTALPLRFSLAH